MSQESTKIVIFSTAFRPFIGGSELAIESIAKNLPEINFEIVTARFSRKLKSTELIKNLNISRVGLGFKFDKYLLPILGYFKARKIIKDSNNFIIHAYQASYGAGAAYIYKLLDPSSKFVLTLQEGKELENQSALIKIFRKMLIKKADAITAISNYLKDYAQKINPHARMFLIPNGVDADVFKRKDSGLSTIKDKLNIKGDDRVIITVSRLVSKNGVADLINAFGEIIKENYETRLKLLIIGSGELENELKELVNDLGLINRVVFLGNIENDQLPDYLSLGDIFVRPSISEGLGTAFLEAMAVGLPVIATPVGGIPDFIEDHETGLFTKPNNPHDLAQKIKEILSNVNLKKKLIDNGRKLIVEKYNWQTVAQKFNDIYLTI